MTWQHATVGLAALIAAAAVVIVVSCIVVWLRPEDAGSSRDDRGDW